MTMCEKAKTFTCGLIIGMCAGAIIVGLNKKAQKMIKQGKDAIVKKMNSLEKRDDGDSVTESK